MSLPLPLCAGRTLHAGRKLLQVSQSNEANGSSGVSQSNQANGSSDVSQSNQANGSSGVRQSNQANGSRNVNQSNQANGSRFVNQSNQANDSGMRCTAPAACFQYSHHRCWCLQHVDGAASTPSCSRTGLAQSSTRTRLFEACYACECQC